MLRPFRLSLAVTPLLLTLALPVPALAQSDADQSGTTQSDADQPLTMEAIEQAWQQGDYVTVRAGLKQLAHDPGLPLAQFRYGRVLLEGRGGPQDTGAAIEWLQRAVDQDLAIAATLLARLYLSGSAPGAERDPERAATLLARAATRGDTEAQYYLGLLTADGDGVEKDEAAALNWLLAAAEQQHVEAQYELSRAYSRGRGTPEDPVKALRWLRAAAGNGHRDAQFFLAHALDTGRGAERNRTEALDWFRRAAEQGHALSQRQLGNRYLQGDGVDKNPAEAQRWLLAAANAGDPGAMNNLAYMLLSGAGVPADLPGARHWYKQAAATGLGRAMLPLGQLYETGKGGARDLPGAVTLYRQAVAAEVPGAREQLARLVLNGTLGPDQAAPHEALSWVAPLARDGQDAALLWIEDRAGEGLRAAQTELGLIRLEQGDSDTALPLLTTAAQAGETRAQDELGQMYSTGTGVAQDYVTAHAWLNVAAASGSVSATGQRDILVNLMTPEQIAKAQDLARDLFDAIATQTPDSVQNVTQTDPGQDKE